MPADLDRELFELITRTTGKAAAIVLKRHNIALEDAQGTPEYGLLREFAAALTAIIVGPSVLDILNEQEASRN